mmetsp:Transcript_96516/g.311684  ORF Transcript_96516/g.311684 Transcript_96516/m.311684 type:complete len:226 (-) Transcript_96516:1283-1960(-)
MRPRTRLASTHFTTSTTCTCAPSARKSVASESGMPGVTAVWSWMTTYMPGLSSRHRPFPGSARRRSLSGFSRLGFSTAGGSASCTGMTAGSLSSSGMSRPSCAAAPQAPASRAAPPLRPRAKRASTGQWSLGFLPLGSISQSTSFRASVTKSLSFTVPVALGSTRFRNSSFTVALGTSFTSATAERRKYCSSGVAENPQDCVETCPDSCIENASAPPSASFPPFR